MLHELQWTMAVAMIAVRMVQAPVDEIVEMISIGGPPHGPYACDGYVISGDKAFIVWRIDADHADWGTLEMSDVAIQEWSNGRVAARETGRNGGGTDGVIPGVSTLARNPGPLSGLIGGRGSLIAQRATPAHWMQSEDPRASVAASNALLDRGYGKPVAQIEMDHHVNEFDGMTDKELGEYIGQQMSKLGIKIEEG